MKIRWTPRAVEDLKSIAKYIARDDPAAARRIADKLKRRAESTGRFPKRGRIVPEFNQEDVRELVESHCRIVYRVTPVAAVILTLFEGHRKLEDSEDHD